MRQALSFHHSAGLLTVLFMLLMTLPGGLRAQQILSVRTIDGMAPGRSAMPVSERVSVAGNFDFDGQGERVSVQLAWRRQGEDAWWVSKPSDPIAVAKAGQGWTLTDVPIGKAFDFRRQLEMMMIAMPAGKAFPEGITDFNAVILSALARSPRYRVYRGSRSRDVFMITPRVRIDQVDGEGVEPEAHLEVGLKPVLTGEVRRPSDGLLRLVVQPLSGDQLWVLPEDPLVRNGRWIAPVDLALADYAHLTEFLVFAVLSRGELPLDKAIDNQRWGELQAQEIMASSSKIRLTRIEAPLPKGEAALRILAVNDQPVRKGETLAVPSQSLIQGVILGRNLQSNEAIWVLGADPYAKEAWRVLGKAEVLNQGRHWNYAPGELGRPGSFLRIVAIIGPLQRNGLDAFLKPEENILCE